MHISAKLRLHTKLAVVFAIVLTYAGLARSQDLVLLGGRVYPWPTANPIDDAVVIVHDGTITAVGRRREVHVPRATQVIDAKDKFITAGFWNSHVHFIEPVWKDAASAPPSRLEEHMQQMVTQWGFTTVFDIASNPQDTIPLRKRVNTGEVPGPKIYTTAGAIYPQNGIPVYLPKDLVPVMKPFEAATPADAARLARQSLAEGGDGIKVFAGAIVGHGKVLPMPRETW